MAFRRALCVFHFDFCILNFAFVLTPRIQAVAILLRSIHVSDSFSRGVIEGFYGRSWSWDAREAYADFLGTNGFGFYIYAPKDDAYLRRQWREPWPDSQVERLTHLASVYTDRGIDWGIGFSPYEIYLSFDDAAKSALEQKIDVINQLNPDILCVLLDDMKGDVPKLAETQVEVFNRIADLSTARQHILCPTYYSFDPILERVFGEMPVGYWEVLGKKIDPAVDFFWTGPEVCSTEYPESHLEEVSNLLGRKPFIWDNYPVNDSKTRSRSLYLRSYENRPHKLSELSAGHAVNPMNQAWMSQIPIWTLGESYRAETAYDPQNALVTAVETLCDAELARAILEDVPTFQDLGLDEMTDDKKRTLVEKYSGYRSPFAEEIVDWLQEGYAFDPACLTE
jgi:hyaluronoglucosaminidase